MLSILIGGLLLWLSFRNVVLKEALQYLLDVPWWVYAAYLLALMFTQSLRAERFRLQLSAMTGKTVGFGEAFAMLSVGMAATFLVPFRLGEFVRPYLGKARGHMSMSAGLSTVAAERVIDGLNTTAMLGLVLLFMRDDSKIPPMVFSAGWVALGVFGSAFIVFVLGYLYRARTVALFHRLIGIVSHKLADKMCGMLDRFLAGLNTLPSWRYMVMYEFYTLAYWFVNGATMYFVMIGMGIDFGWLGAFFVLSCLVIGVMIPAPPGNVGNFDYAIVLPLTALGLAPALAAAYAVAIHLMQAVQMTGVGLFYVATGRISMQRVMEATTGNTGDDEAV